MFPTHSPEMLIGDEKKEQPLSQKTASNTTLAMIAFWSFDTGSPSAAFCYAAKRGAGMQGV